MNKTKTTVGTVEEVRMLAQSILDERRRIIADNVLNGTLLSLSSEFMETTNEMRKCLDIFDIVKHYAKKPKRKRKVTK